LDSRLSWKTTMQQFFLLVGLVVLLAAIWWLARQWLERLGRRSDLESGERKPREDAVVTGASYLMVISVGFYAVAEAAMSLRSPLDRGACIAVMAAIAALQAGSLIGFLFGIPRVVGNKLEAPPQSNTSLEQIADWLTKIIVGIGLVQARRFYELFQEATTFLAAGVGDSTPGAKVLAASILIFFPAIGFLGTYLITRLYLAAALGRAESDIRTAFQIAGVKATEAEAARATISGNLFRILKGDMVDLKELSPEEQETIEKVGALEYHELKNADELATWGLAKLIAGKAEEASKALQRAALLEPKSAEFAFSYSVAFAANATNAEVEKALRQALKRVSRQTDPEVAKNIYKSLTYLLLYREGGYEEVIKLADDFHKSFPRLKSGGILVNVACAYGQQLISLREKAEKNGKRLAVATEKEIKAKALGAITQALAIDPEWHSRLQLLMYPDHPAKAESREIRDENDLEVFAEDPEFIKTVGKP
jgi:tetratricopeptide (TPR) repeat protein